MANESAAASTFSFEPPECADFAEAMKCQLDFAQESWSRSVGEASKLFDHLRTQPS
jgi:hypothetical protein